MSSPPPPPSAPTTPSPNQNEGSSGGGVSSSLVTAGLTPSLHGSATTFGAPRGTGFGSAFQSSSYSNTPGGIASASGYSMSSTPGAETPGTPLTARGDRRSRLVRERSRSSAAFASSTSIGKQFSPGMLRMDTPMKSNVSAAVGGPGKPGRATSKTEDVVEEEDEEEEPEEEVPALFTSFCYKGMEVIFTAINPHGKNSDGRCHLLGIHARSRVPFQKCYIDHPYTDKSPPSPSKTTAKSNHVKVEIVQLTSHPSTGLVYAADNVGNVRSFRPRRSDPMVEAYGKFRWEAGSVARCCEVFGYAPPVATPFPAAAAKEVAVTWDPAAGPGGRLRKSLPIPQLGNRDVSAASAASLREARSASESVVIPNVSMEVTETGLEVEVEDELMERMNSNSGGAGKEDADRPEPTQNRDLSVERLVEVLSDTFSRSTVRDAGKGAAAGSRVCFYRRKKKPSSSASIPLRSPDSTGSGGSLQSHYPLTEGQPPLPPTTLSYSADHDDAAEGRDEYGVMICASMTEKRVLVVHKDQLAIFDFSLAPAALVSPSKVPPPSSFQSGKDGENDASNAAFPLPEALLLWTHKLQGSIVDHASLSGDGCAIALALRGEGVGVPYPFGVRTFVRDGEDGSGDIKNASKNNATKAAGASSKGGSNDAKNAGKSNNAAAPRSGGKPPVHRRTASGVKALPIGQSPPLPHGKNKASNFDGLMESVFGDAPPTSSAKNAAKATNSAHAAPVAKRQGILYKPHQFLVHSATVTRLAFRGYGTLTSSAQHNCDADGDSNDETEEGNDLLLTTCSGDCSVRIFSQNSWRQLMHWNSPPKSRADWVRGICAANLGDLDDDNGGGSKKSVGRKDSGQLTPIPKDMDRDSRHSGSGAPHSSAQEHKMSMSDAGSVSSVNSTDTGGINRALLATKNHRPAPSAPNTFPSQSVTGTHAGAWIAELTFRNAFPALRLSRLSYMKTGGDDALPAHFESVAAILPPGSLMEEVVLDSEDDDGGFMGCGECRMEVEGIWPAWDPWEPGPRSRGGGGGVGSGEGNREANGTDSRGGRTPGSPSSNPLGSSSPGNPSAATTPRWLGDGMSDLGGSHVPPSELRITSSSHPSRSFSSRSCLTQIEMPLWGDKDFGAMEFGAPTRYVMMTPETGEGGSDRRRKKESPSAVLEYESGSRLCARTSPSPDGRGHTIDLCWRRHGAVNLEEIAEGGGESGDLRRFLDLSLVPLPLSLPSLTLPKFRHAPSRADSMNVESMAAPLTSNFADKHAVASLHWWPDENHGGPPRLVAVTLAGTIIVYEMPPPWSALEPPMPSYDPFFDSSESRGSSADSDFEPEFDVSAAAADDENHIVIDHSMDSAHSFGEGSGRAGGGGRGAEYEVHVAPHPDFGLGLRLEAQTAGLPAVAGSFKKHPLSGGRLPAERSGAIALGDELLAVNDVGLEGMRFEDAIAAVRQIGFDSYGAPLRMRFRRCRGKRTSMLSSLGSGRRSRTHTVDSKESTRGVVLEAEGTLSTSATLGGAVVAGFIDRGCDGGAGGAAGSLATVEVGADAEIQQGFGRIIAVVRYAVSAHSPPDGQRATPDALVAPPAILLLPWNFGKGATVSHKMYGGALILWAVPTTDPVTGGRRNAIKAARLEAVLDVDPANARFVEMGSIALDDDKEEAEAERSVVESISFVSSTEKGWLVAVHDSVGNVSLLFVETAAAGNDSTVSNFGSTPPLGASNLRATFRHYPCIFSTFGKGTGGLGNKCDGGSFLLRSFSLELFGGMDQREGGCKELTVWSALPRTIHRSMHASDESAQFLEYHKVTISVDDVPQLSSEEVILDFQWASSGFMDAFPWLVVLTTSAAVVYRRSAVQRRWRPAAMFSYGEKLRAAGSAGSAAGAIDPQDAFPHLITALRCLGLSNDERTGLVRSDWHPESILASVCTEERGAALALKSYVRGLYDWLSLWMSPNESMRPGWDGHGPLSGAPYRIVSDKTVLVEEEDEEDGGPAETVADLFASAPAKNAEKPRSKEDVLLAELQTALLPTVEPQSDKEIRPEEKKDVTKRSREFLLAMSYARTKARNQAEEDRNKKPSCPLPLPLQNLNEDERRCLWAIGDILSNKSPSFKTLDPSAQLCMFGVMLMRRLLGTKATKQATDPVNSMPVYEGGRPTMPTKQASTRNGFGRERLRFDRVASAALLSALMSDRQAMLLDSCRPSQGEKFTWESTRAVGVPYWVRSDKLLAQVAEEIAQSLYKFTKDVMDCALYYVAMRNMTKLRAIAATDRSDQGKKFLKFIMDFDFSSDRGRQAAEKNAYSLLRKRKYSSAACFFLLAEPPMIKTALDVIKSQLQDPALAFFVARLVEGAPKKTPGGGGLTIGGGFNLRSMGGGGGFAGGGGFVGPSGTSGGSDAEEDATVKFELWKPMLGKSARSVLLPKYSSEGMGDVCFESLQLLWLGRPREATLRLSHMPTASLRDDGVDDGVVSSGDLSFPPIFGAPQSESLSETAEVTIASENARVLERVNAVINFCAGPSLLKKMKPKKRILLTSALLVSRALSRCGMEIPSMRILLQVADPAYEEEEESARSDTTQRKKIQPSNNTSSSIFDSYDAAPSRPKPAAPKQLEAMSSSIFGSFDAPPPKPKEPPSDPMPSSIFDSFDVAPPKPKPAAPKPPSSDPMSSSVFDSFDAAPPKPKPAAPKPSPPDPMSSSIFDSFDAAPPKPKPAAPKAPQSDPMSSSIFDSFDAAPPKPTPATSDPMSSSIFDSFDAAPPKPKPAAPKQPASDPISSSIFDSFDAAPQKPKPAAPKQSPSGSMSSSIFDSFDAAPRKSKPPAPKQSPSGSMSSSIFDSFDAAPQRRPRSSAQPASKARTDAVDEVEKEQPLNIPSCPALWNEWRDRLIYVVAARRFLRELARIVSSFDGEPSDVVMEDFERRSHPIIRTGAAEVLHNACDSEGLLNSIFKSLSELNTSFGIGETVIIEQALRLMSATRQPKRLVFAVLLHCLLGRGDLAEDLVRDAASFQMNCSEFLGFSNDTIVDNAHTQYYSSSLWARRESSCVIWQLELCLWLYRGGAFDMSSIAMKETLLAVRVGLAAAAWGRCHNSLDTLIKAEPDCLMDFDAGKNLWKSMKIIVVNENTVAGIDGVTSGGWEFLVDCRRDEATEMLRDGKTGQFLIRPHPQDPGVFTLSFKTNLVPTEPIPTTNYDEAGTINKPLETPPSTSSKKIVKRDDVVQHAIIRLSDSGFRCGSFGPFATLVKLLHAVSDSLPFDLRFSDPPIKGIISEKGTQTSPNSFLFRKLALHSKAQFFQFQSSKNLGIEVTDIDDGLYRDADDGSGDSQLNLYKRFGLLSQLMFLTELRKQLCAVAAAVEDDQDAGVLPHEKFPDVPIDDDFDGSITEGSLEADDAEEALGVASRMVKPLLNWVRSREIDIVDEVSPLICHNEQRWSSLKLFGAINSSGDQMHEPSRVNGGDSMIRRMIQGGSGVDFRTLRVGEAGNSVIVVLFGKQDAIKWLMTNETRNDEAEAKARLKLMELTRVIEPITSSDLSIPKSYAASHPSTESRYRFVDPWEVEALESRSGETASAALGRGRYQTLSVGLIANSCEKIVRAAGGLHLLGLWSTLKGGITLTKALCSAHPPWERGAGGDLLMKKGFLMEPSPYDNSIRQHLYGNYLFRRLELPQRFLALVQVELLDLKNVTSPSGSSSLTAYALLRLKRQGSSAPLNHKARSLDSACTQARKISKQSSGPNSPASWGSLVRFRFPLPEGVNCEGRSFDLDRESLFKGPPTCLQITVYEKKFMSDFELGGADVNIDSLGSGGQIEEWVPLRAGKDGITWFARIRLSLRFELLCLDPSFDASETGKKERCPSVGLKKISFLSRLGAHEDHKQGMKNSISTPDFGQLLTWG